MGLLQSVLECKMLGAELQVLHPSRGKLPVTTEAGCPMLPRSLALDLIDEIEEAKSNVFLKSLGTEDEKRWLQQLIRPSPCTSRLAQGDQGELGHHSRSME